jgi:Flp pilus assembly protein TadG
MLAAPPKPRGRNRQRGQALIEFAMTFVFLMLLLAGVTDIGTLLDVHIAIVYSARQGARTGAVIGAQSAADCAIAGAVHSGLVNQPNLTMTRLIIYKATGTTNGRYTGTQPADIYVGNVKCVTGTITDSNNNPVAQSGSNPWTYDQRNVTPFVEDSIAVEIDYTYQMQFNLLGSTFVASDFADSTMSPQGIATPAPTPTP